MTTSRPEVAFQVNMEDGGVVLLVDAPTTVQAHAQALGTPLEDFGEAVNSMRAVLQRLYDGLNGLDPAQISVTLGLTIKSGSVLKLVADAEAQVQVTLSWGKGS
ncbi:hypothetical protein [Deinococcus sonorensis]|uniref:Trypsin-co-occurring domain-containing protein n=2 Tax=Deinococcus sonorensis TaxID=309891 RepID=A0AAU7U937_9DEIO